MIPNETEVLNAIATRAYQLFHAITPGTPETAPGAFHSRLVSGIYDMERSLNLPSVNPEESCLKAAIREFYVAPPPTPDEVLADHMAAEAAKAAAANKEVR